MHIHVRRIPMGSLPGGANSTASGQGAGGAGSAAAAGGLSSGPLSPDEEALRAWLEGAFLKKVGPHAGRKECARAASVVFSPLPQDHFPRTVGFS